MTDQDRELEDGCASHLPKARHPCDPRQVTQRKTEPLPKGLRKELALAQIRKGKLMLTLHDLSGSRSVALAMDGRWLLGRDPSCDLQLDDHSVSGVHALVEVCAAGAQIEDLGSRNGTWLNGERITLAALRPGDHVGIGAAQGVVTSLRGNERDLTSHEVFVARASEEITRARELHRPLTVAMVQADSGPLGHVAYWGGKLAAVARPYQLVGCFAARCVELLLPELEQAAADELMPDLCARAGLLTPSSQITLRWTAASVPGAGSDIESVLYTLRRQLTEKTPAQLAQASPFLPIDSWLPPEVRQALFRLAPTKATVLVVGETGTGKERFAHELHNASKSAHEPFVALSCAAIPEHLAESLLFGHRAGAFTGAREAQPGVFANAGKGTVFVDGVDSLSPRLQGVLLEVLESGQYRPVGASASVTSAARIVAATHRDADALVKEGVLREDLRHRLGASTITLPPLRGRPQLIGELAHHFARLSAQQNEVPPAEVPPPIVELLCAYRWPGNMRELRNVVERGVLLAEQGQVRQSTLPAAIRQAVCGAGERLPEANNGARDYKERIERFERSLLLGALREADWNQSDTARQLGISRRTVVRKIKALSIEKLARKGA